MHLCDGSPGDAGVVPGLAQPRTRVLLPEFEVWHVDVHQTLQELQGPEAVIAAGVVHNGHPGWINILKHSLFVKIKLNRLPFLQNID